jgi:hypothetical protein
VTQGLWPCPADPASESAAGAAGSVPVGPRAATKAGHGAAREPAIMMAGVLAFDRAAALPPPAAPPSSMSHHVHPAGAATHPSQRAAGPRRARPARTCCALAWPGGGDRYILVGWAFCGCHVRVACGSAGGRAAAAAPPAMEASPAPPPLPKPP